MITRHSTWSVERVVATAFYAPIGLGAQLADDLPGVVDRARQELTLARFVGKMAVERGAREFRQRLRPTRPGDIVADPIDVVSSVGELGRSHADGDAVLAAHGGTPCIEVDELALPDYDQLPASQILGKLDGLTPAERNQVEAYETAGRHRRTVLGKLAQLRDT